MGKTTFGVGSLVVGLLSVSLYVGCSAPAPTGEAEKVGATDQAVTLICANDLGYSVPWLIHADCTCSNYSGDQLTQCNYELGALACLMNAGWTGTCAGLPALPVVKVTDTLKGVAYYEDLNLDTYFPRSCSAQQAARACLYTLNGSNGYSAPPIAAQITHHCTISQDHCAGPGGNQNYLDVFDPCSTASCHM